MTRIRPVAGAGPAARAVAPPHEVVLRQALTWLAAEVDRFRLPPQDALTPGEIGATRKAFGELCVALVVLARDPVVRGWPQVRVLVEHLRGAVADPVTFAGLGRSRGLLAFHVTVAAAAHAWGLDLGPVRETIQSLISRGHLVAAEQTPWNLLDRRCYLAAGGFRHDLPAPRDLVALSSVARLPGAGEMGVEDVYALTHVLFHLADFGQTDPREDLGHHAAQVTDHVRLLLGATLAANDWDLVAELLMSAACLGPDVADCMVQLGWSALAGAQHDDGWLPGRCHDADPPPTEDLEAVARHRFDHGYHPVLATVLAGLVRRAVDRRVETGVPPGAVSPGAVPPAAVSRAAVSPPRPRPDVAALARGVLRWLEDVLPRVQAARPGRLPGAVVLAALCVDLHPPLHAAGSAVAGAAAAHLDEAAVEDAGGLDVLLCARVLQRWGLVVPAPVEQVMADARDALRAAGPKLGGDARLLAAALACGADVPAPSDVALPAGHAALLGVLTAGKAAVPLTCDAVDLATSCGQRPLADPLAGLGQVLEAMATQACRQHRLVDAARLLRALVAVGEAASSGAQQTAGYLRANLTPAGDIGFLDEEAALMVSESGDPHAGLDLRLPTTTACAWAVAEHAVPGRYRALRDLGRRTQSADSP